MALMRWYIFKAQMVLSKLRLKRNINILYYSNILCAESKYARGGSDILRSFAEEI
jgi:hypothetical protein